MQLRFERGGRESLETLHPAYFAMVMATGIVALAAKSTGVPWIPGLLFWLNTAFLTVLCVVTVLRLFRYPTAVMEDVRSHSRGVGFSTAVAAFGVFGAQLLVQMHAPGLAVVFWLAATALWVVLTYGVLAVLTVVPDKPNLVQGLNGGWLVSVVATQSVALLTLLLLSAGEFPNARQLMSFVALTLWLSGGALYLWLMTLIFFRYTFLCMSPEDLTPPYWINMGAVAISTLTGTWLLDIAGLSPTVAELVPFIKGFTLFFWAVGTWWIPMLLVLGVWRYLIRGFPFSYDPLYWGGVFPLGMYSVCTYRLTQVLDVPFLTPLARLFALIALLAWALTFFGMLDSLFHNRAKPAA